MQLFMGLRKNTLKGCRTVSTHFGVLANILSFLFIAYHSFVPFLF